MWDVMAEENLATEQNASKCEVFHRSSDRCHLISCEAIAAATGRVPFYLLSFTAGKVFTPNALEERHIHHVLTGYVIRRDISNFVGKGKAAFLKLPLSPKLLDYIEVLPTGRMVIALKPGQEASGQAQHLLKTLHHLNMRFAINLDDLVTTQWIDCLNAFNFVFIDMSDGYFTENLVLYNQLKKQCPWLKLIVTGIKNPSHMTQAFAVGADYIIGNYQSPKLRSAVRKVATSNPQLLMMVQGLFSDVPDVEVVAYLAGFYPTIIKDFYAGLKYLGIRREITRKINNVQEALEVYGPELVGCMLGVGVVHVIYESFEVSEPNGYHENQAYLPFRNSIIRAFFLYYCSKKAERDYKEQTICFLIGLFSLWTEIAKFEGLPVAEKNAYFDESTEYGKWNVSLLKAARGFEFQDLASIAEATFDTTLSLGTLLKVYEKAIMRAEDVLGLILNPKASTTGTVGLA